MTNNIPNWPEWEVHEIIGKGGFGAVYEIRRDVFGDIEKAALKVISIPQDSGEIEYMRCEGLDDESISMSLQSQVGDFIKEYKLMARMRENHNIVHCDDFRYIRHEKDPGWDIYLKMELLTPLMRVLDRLEDENEVIRLGIEMCNALIACQKHNIIHRDIKPQNIFISPEGYYKLGDFGIARTMEHTTRATGRIGTLSFMAPEVEFGKIYNATVDIYSLGLVLYWLLNERRVPFVPLPPAVPTRTINEQARVRRISGEPIPEPKYGCKALKAVVLKACAFAPEDRYQTAEEMMKALKGITEKSSQVQPDGREPVHRAELPDEEDTVYAGNLHREEKSKDQGNPETAGNAEIQKESPLQQQAEACEQSTTPVKVPKKKKAAIILPLFLIAISVLAITLLYQRNGWHIASGQKYYYQDGVVQTGWKTIDEEEYYFDSEGVMQTGFVEIDGETYFFNSEGVMQTGWLWRGSQKFYLKRNGMMQTGFSKIGEDIYYFNSKGVAQTGRQIILGAEYYFLSDGSLLE